MIEVPLLTLRLAIFRHQDVVLLPQITVEELEQQTLPAFRVFVELIDRTVKVPIFSDFDFDATALGCRQNRLANT